jgi:hypothetical protein
MKRESIFYSCLVVAWLCSCRSLGEVTTIASNKELYTVTVYVKNSQPLITIGPALFHIGYPYVDGEIIDEHIGPVSKIVYERMNLTEYEELCRRLKDHTEILAIQKQK